MVLLFCIDVFIFAAFADLDISAKERDFPMNRITKTLSFFLTVILLICGVSVGMTASAAKYNWAGAWGSPAIESGVLLGNDSVFEQNGIHLRDHIPANSTVRTVIQPTMSGSKIRLKFSNAFGSQAVTINETTIAKTGATNDIVAADTITQVTFNGGHTSITMSAGSEVYSDEIEFPVNALEKISISTYFRSATPMYTVGLYGGVSYLASSLGNRTHNTNMTAIASRLEFTSNSITYYTIPFLSRMDVYAENAYCVVIVGDSTVTNDSYLLLAQKLNSAGIHNVGVVMSGIIGNRILYDGAGVLAKVYGQSLLKRANRDVFSVAGAKYVIVKIGDNDVLHPMENSMLGIAPYASASEIIEGYREFSRMASGKGLNLYICTRTPYKGYERNFLGDKDLTWTQKGEDMLREINSWVRNSYQGYYNGCIDLDAMRDPNDPASLRSQMTTDGIHFSRLGQIAFVDLIPEYAYGVNTDLTDIATVLNVNPYAAPTPAAPTTSANNNHNSEATTAAQNNQNTATTAAPSTTAPTAVTPSTAEPSTNNNTPTLDNANQILVNDNNNTGAPGGTVTPIGNVSDDTPSSSGGSKQMAGFAILAALAVAIIAVAVVLLMRLNPKRSLPFTRASYGRANQKKRV